MLVYEGIKQEFLDDVVNDLITDRIYEKYRQHVGRSGEAQIRSWKNSMEYMYKVLIDEAIPYNSGVAIEFKIPGTAKRIDFIISGYDNAKKESVVIIELKQWQSCETVLEADGLIMTYLGKGLRETTHPSYQAWSYASLMRDFNESVQNHDIMLYPCAYLHNYKITEEDPINNDIYKEYLKEAPLFGYGDVIKLRNFIKRHISEGDNKELLYLIENGKLRPSKMLQDTLVNMLDGNREFIMIDEQKVIYEDALRIAEATIRNKEKNVLIIQGGPGTGKTVLAINLLVELTKRNLVCNYITKNSAPREVFYEKLRGNFPQKHIRNLFKGSGNYIDEESNIFDVLIVDEAHRLNEKSGIFSNLGESQTKEIINASKFSIFFIDEDQRIHIKDAGNIATIKQYAKDCGASFKIVELESQFRCNGSDGYLAWLDNILEIKETTNYDFDFDYDFKVIDSPIELRELIVNRNTNNKARMVAGYCWDWITTGKTKTDVYDIVIDEYDFKMSWNLYGSIWAIDKDTVNEVGCIHTSQGLEFDYVGVIIGDDIRYENGDIVTDYTKRAKTDKSLTGIKKISKENEKKAKEIADRIIKNTYRTLMTRGMKGCYIFCMDKNLQQYFKDKLVK